MMPDQMHTAVTDAGKVNKHLKSFNDKVRYLMKNNEERFNRWVLQDAKLQNAILSSIDKALTPQVCGCATANAMYRILKDLNNTSNHTNAASAWHTFIDLRVDTCKSIRDYIEKFCEALTASVKWDKYTATVPATASPADTTSMSPSPTSTPLIGRI
jgi:hypothetical protein